MKFFQYLIILPFVIIALLAVTDADICSETQAVCFRSIKLEGSGGFKLGTVLVVFLIFGYLLGRISAWFGYSPIRRALRIQRRENRALNKEQAKLNETVSGLKQDIIREKAQREQAANSQPKKGWWKSLKGSKKGN